MLVDWWNLSYCSRLVVSIVPISNTPALLTYDLCWEGWDYNIFYQHIQPAKFLNSLGHNPGQCFVFSELTMDAWIWCMTEMLSHGYRQQSSSFATSPCMIRGDVPSHLAIDHQRKNLKDSHLLAVACRFSRFLPVKLTLAPSLKIYISKYKNQP